MHIVRQKAPVKQRGQDDRQQQQDFHRLRAKGGSTRHKKDSRKKVFNLFVLMSPTISSDPLTAPPFKSVGLGLKNKSGWTIWTKSKNPQSFCARRPYFPFRRRDYRLKSAFHS
jgi:hypothetical protein